MSATYFGHCTSFIERSIYHAERSDAQRPSAWTKPAVTVSRQLGAGGGLVAQALTAYLQERVAGPYPWTLFDQNLIQKVLEEHRLSDRVSRFMAEDARSGIEEMIEEILGLHPASSVLVRKTSETILRLSQSGNVILVGRGANVITARLSGVFHVRLIGSLERRIDQVEKTYAVTAKVALEMIRQEDQARKRYLKRHFNKNIDDPLLYHLVVNTDGVPYEETAEFVGDAALRHFKATGVELQAPLVAAA